MTSLETEFQQAVDSKKLQAVAGIALDANGAEIFKTAHGTTDLEDPSAPKFRADTSILIFSCTKLVTSVAALQLLENGKIELDDLAEKYIPEIANIKVLQGFEEGKPILRDPKTKPTILNLLTHTAGFSYDFFDQDCLKWRVAVGQNPAEYVTVSQLSNYQSPYRHDPGADYTYGPNIDFLGFVIEKVSGMKLHHYFEQCIFQPLGLKNTGLVSQRGKDFLTIYMRNETGAISANRDIVFPENAEVIAGGHFLTSTMDDYAQFLLSLLNKGTHPNGATILKEETVKNYLFKDFIPQICSDREIGKIRASIPQLTNEGEMMPGISKGWSCGLLINNEDLPNGRAKGSGSWAGLGNLYYWIDPRNGKLGLVVSGLLPFFDPTVLHLFDALERKVYGKNVVDAGGAGSNYVVTSAIDGAK